MSVVTSPQSEQLAYARSVLAALARGRAPLDALPAVEALAVIETVPPYPPVVELADDVVVSEQTALDALAAAVEASADIPEIGRLVQGAESLRTPVPQ